MAHSRLSKRFIDSLPVARKGADFYWDADLKGFGAKVTRTGRKVFVLQYRPAGARQSRRLTLGAYGQLTPEEARQLAKKYLGAVANGHDPAGDKAGAKRAVTVGVLGDDYLADVDARKRPSTAREYRRLWDKHVSPALGSIKVSRVTVANVAALHRQMRGTPYMANRVLAMLGAFFTYAARQGIRPRQENPAHDVPFYPETARERFLTPAEAVKLGHALKRAETKGLLPAPTKRRKRKTGPTAKHRPRSVETPLPMNPYAIAALRFLLLSGWREGEALTLKWSDLDLARRTATLAQTKTGRSIRRLGAPACDLLSSLPRIEGSLYIFPGKTLGKPLVELSRVWYAVRHAAGLDDVRLHDLRHSFASAVASSGSGNLLIIGALLGHTDSTTTAKYAHLFADPVQAAADATAEQIAGWLGIAKRDDKPRAVR